MKLQWKPFNVITVNVIIWLLLSNLPRLTKSQKLFQFQFSLKIIYSWSTYQIGIYRKNTQYNFPFIKYVCSSFTYCCHSVNAISLSRAPSDHIKRCLISSFNELTPNQEKRVCLFFLSFPLSFFLSYSPSLILSFSPSLFLSFSLSLFLSLFLSFFPSYSLTLFLSFSLSLFLSFSLSLFLFLSFLSGKSTCRYLFCSFEGKWTTP